MARQKREIYDVDEAETIENIGGIEGNETKYFFAIRLNEILKEKEITQKQFCEDTEIAVGSMSSYRNGKSEPTITNLRIIADYIGVSSDWLLGLTNTKIYFPDSKDETIENLTIALSDCQIKLKKISKIMKL